MPWNTLNQPPLLGSSLLYRKRNVEYGITPTAFSLFCLFRFKRIRYSLNFILLKTKICRLKNVVFQDTSRSTSNTNTRLKSFLREGQRIQFLLEMNCQHCLFLALLCMTKINIGLEIISLNGNFWSNKTRFWTILFQRK